MRQIRYLSETEQTEIDFFSMKRMLEIMKQVFLTMDSGEYAMAGVNQNAHGSRLVFPRKVDDKSDVNLFYAMPGYIGGDFQAAGIKWHGPNVAGSSEAETQFTLIINDKDTGNPIGIFPANILTSYRTAAVSLLAAKYLVLPDIETVGIIGPGKINWLFFAGLIEQFPTIKSVRIKGRGKKSIETFVEKIRYTFPNIREIVVTEHFEEAVSDCDVISVNTGWDFASVGDMPILRTGWIKPGAVVLCSAFVKFSDEFIAKKSVKVADNLKMYQCYAQEVGYPAYKSLSNLGNRYVDLIHENKMKETDVIELSQIVKEGSTAYRSKRDIVIVALGGMAIEDIAVGCELLKFAEQKNAGTLLER